MVGFDEECVKSNWTATLTVVSLASLKCKYWLQSSSVSCEANLGQRSIEAVTVNEGSQDEVHVQLYTIHSCELNCIREGVKKITGFFLGLCP